MNKLILVYILSLSAPLYAGGTWGGGTPPLTTHSVEVWFDIQPALLATLDKGEAAMVPSVKADSLIQLGDGATIVPVPKAVFKWIVHRIKRVGEAILVVDNGVVLQFTNEDGWPVDAVNYVRAVNADDKLDNIDSYDKAK